MEKTTPTTKVCKKCGRELPADAFNRHAKSKDGLQPYCRECQREVAMTGAAKAGRPKKAHPVTPPPSQPVRHGDPRTRSGEGTEAAWL